MKRIISIAFLVILLFSFSSCKKEEERFFDYQDELKTVKGTYTQDSEKYELTLYFEREEGQIQCRRVEYTSPESLAGVTFTLEGDKITAELEGIRIAYSYFEKESVFRAARLFALCEEDIYDIKSGKNKTTVSYGKNEGVKWEVVTSKDGAPVRITYEDKDITGVFEVENIELFEDEDE